MIKGFPYEPRKNQDVLLELVGSALSEGRDLVVESGTGTGKTICSLAPAVAKALELDKKVLYLTHTNSQQHQVIVELRRIRDSLGESNLYGCGLQGRGTMCLLTQDEPELATGDHEELSKLCADRRAGSKVHMDGGRTKKGRCKYFEKASGIEFPEFLDRCKREMPSAEELVSICHQMGACPYILTKRLLPKADIVAAPYIYFFSPFIRRNLMETLGVDITDLIIIVDEAHNLGEYARELASADVSARGIELAQGEVKEFGEKILLEDIRIGLVLEHLMEVVLDIRDHYLVEPGQEDSLIMSSDLQVELLSALRINSVQLSRMVADMLIYGETVRETKRARGKLARSYVYSIASFLRFWMELEESEYARLVSVGPGGDNPRVEAYCLNPAVITEVVKTCHASVHMSGTLQPLNEYRDSIGLPGATPMEIVESPFPQENLKKYFLEDVTTRYEDLSRDKQMFQTIHDRLRDIINAQDRNTALFFPSFNLMDKMLDMGLVQCTRGKVYANERNQDQRDLMTMVKAFKAGKGELMCSVIGGRISEGMDFPGEELEVVALVGIPFPKPTARQRALVDYYDRKFGLGWEYAITAPTTRKMLQAIGRIQRNPTDRGVAVILDHRARMFNRFIPNLQMSWDIGKDIKDFFNTS